MDIDKKINMAINICNNGRYKKVKFLSIYPFTTENISAYIDMFDLKDRTLLTVGSSSDQVFNAILKGCHDITLFDICPFTEEYYYLKTAAIKLMDRNEYLNFLCYKNYPRLFSKNSQAFLESDFYSLLAYLEELKPEVSYFWCELLKRYKGRYIRKNLFNKDEYEVSVLKIMNRYLEDDMMYNLLRKRIDDINISFEYDNIFNIDDSKHYDNIFLSNIAAYHTLENFKYLYDICTKILNDEGKMLVSYLYDTDINTEYMSCEDEIYNLHAVFSTFKEVILTSFVGNNGLRYADYSSRDSVLTYEKIKK